ncbi:MAG: hypothetical protein IPN46_12030 [Saprospiraceae bacterium]|nr:hypothetical protein [Saprospiraceae bacterium]
MWKTFHKFAKYEYKKNEKSILRRALRSTKSNLIESGKLTTGSVAAQFDVSYTAVYQWVKKYGKLTPPDKIVIESDSDYLKVVELQKEKSNLSGLLQATN